MASFAAHFLGLIGRRIEAPPGKLQVLQPRAGPSGILDQLQDEATSSNQDGGFKYPGTEVPEVVVRRLVGEHLGITYHDRLQPKPHESNEVMRRIALMFKHPDVRVSSFQYGERMYFVMPAVESGALQHLAWSDVLQFPPGVPAEGVHPMIVGEYIHKPSKEPPNDYNILVHDIRTPITTIDKRRLLRILGKPRRETGHLVPFEEFLERMRM